MHEARLNEVIRDFAGVKPGEDFDMEGAVEGLDSLDKLDLIHRLEDEFDIKIHNLDNIENYQDLVREIRSKVS